MLGPANYEVIFFVQKYFFQLKGFENDFDDAYPRNAIPDMKKELSYFSINPMNTSESPIKIDSVIEFLIFDKNGVVNLGSGV